ncbi:MAG: bifunctional riboflavin kinase/FAD synthetase [Armatimonadetes bacterium]|nr:bifunctional riboflavin kinase/FAD synthetase [Armatimonadota bacterium]
MEVIMGLESVKPAHQDAVLCLGFFDGLHLGHRRIVQTARELGTDLGRKVMFATFDRHPNAVLRPEKIPPLLTTLSEKEEIAESLGIDFFLVLVFDPAFSRFSRENFVQAVLFNALNVRAVAAGYNYRFGAHKSGDISFLARMGERYGFTVVSVPPVMDGDAPISSTRIRDCLRKGQIEAAARYLGQSYSLRGTVVEGAHRGKPLGFPTANIAVAVGKAIPQSGVYACRVDVGGTEKLSVTNIGTRPTFKDEGLVVETHILDFQGDLYGQPLTVFFEARLRGERKFASPDALKAQVQQDIKAARTLRASPAPKS